MLTFRFSKADGQMLQMETLTSGMVGKEAKLEFTEEWEDFAKTVVFTAGCESRVVADPGEVVVIPHEVLAESRNHLYVGVYGVAADGRVIPSVRIQGPWIHPGIDPVGDESLEPTLPVWAQMQQQIDDLRRSAEPYQLPVGGNELGGVKNGGNVTINPDGTMTAPEITAQAVELDASLTQSGKAADAKAVGDALKNVGNPGDDQVSAAVSAWLNEHPEATTTVADGSVTAAKLADGAVTASKMGHSDDEYVGNIGDKYYIPMDFAWSSYSKPQREGTCRLYAAKAGDVFCMICDSFTGDSGYYSKYWLIDPDLSVIHVLQTCSGRSIVVEQDGYLLVNEQTPCGTRTKFNVYRNCFVDKAFVPAMYDTETLLSLTEGLMNGLKGIVTSCNTKIQYEPGYYIAYTDGHNIINFPNIVMIHGDVVYYDGQFFHHCPELTRRSTPVKKKHYNVVIIGSGAGGIATALNLMGTGMDVALIEKNHHLGGTHTCAGAIDLCASPADDSLKQVVREAWEDGYASMGRITFGTTEGDDFDLRWNGSHLNWPVAGATNMSGGSQGNHICLDHHYLQQYYYRKLKEGGVDVFLDTEVVDAVYDGEYLRAVTTADGAVFNGDFFVDAGDNIIMRRAGEMDVDYFYGYDGSDRFGESKVKNAAPNKGTVNRTVLGMEQFSGYQIHVPYPKSISGTSSSWNTPRTGEGCKYAKSADWASAHPLQIPDLDNPYAYTRTQVTLGCDSMGITATELLENGEALTYAKYANAAIRNTTNAATVALTYREPNEMLGIRESYRLNAVYMATQTDCEIQLTELGNNSILSSWYTEHHALSGMERTLYMNLTGIPIQTMFSPKFKNYINPSKGKGVSHLAHSTFRLMRTCWLSGRLAAEIIKLCWQTTLDVHNVDVAAVNENSGVSALFVQLQQFMEEAANR